MKRLINVIVFTSLIAGTALAQSSATITVKGSKKETGTFQSEGAYGFQRIDPNEKGEFVLKVDDFSKGHGFIYVSANQNYNFVYLTPGASVVLIETPESIAFEGDNKRINEFINKNRYVGYTSGSDTKNYSLEWLSERDKELDSLNDRLVKAGFPEDFNQYQTYYWLFESYKNKIEGPANASMFGREQVVLPPNYFSFLKDMKFDNIVITKIPKWWLTMKQAFEQMEKEGYIPVSKENYIGVYAQQIPDKQLRSKFIIAMLSHTLDMGYNDDYMNYIAQVNAYVLPEDQADLQMLKDKYAKIQQNFASLKRGSKAPQIEGVDMNGKEYKLSDFAGNVVVVDFWFSGCVPCKAEMPVMEKMAENMKDQKIKFISVSLDSGKQLTEAWKNIVKDKGDETLNLNLPLGYKSDEAKNYIIRGVPRIIVIDQNGNLVDANAKRPSDPKLKALLDSLL
ncbi:MAG: TlpA family protein disulfide reductase [Bacteroidales bacterium]